jgi:hypothetical protein
MTIRAPFQPKVGSNAVVTPAAASAATTVDANSRSVRLVNSGANICYVRISAAAAAATTADLPVRSGESIIVSKAPGQDQISYISAAGTTLNIQPGEGGI